MSASKPNSPNLRNLIKNALSGVAERGVPEGQSSKVQQKAKRFLKQFKLHPGAVAYVVASAIQRLAQEENTTERKMLLQTLTFFKSAGTFYDVELCVTDSSAYLKRLRSWKKEKAAQRSKQKSNVDIGRTLEIDGIYTRTVTNESNLFAGRNTLANVE